MDFAKVLQVFQDRKPQILGSQMKKQYAIVLPIIEKSNGLHLLFQVRSAKLRSQPGDISFPGGRIEPTDTTACAAAVRETSEELGIPKEHIVDVHPLDYMVGDIHIYPFVAKILEPEIMCPNPDEVAEIFTVPLKTLLHMTPEIHYVDLEAVPRAGFPYELIPGGKDYQWRKRQLLEPFYLYQDRVIWGWTAMILGHFLNILNEN